jgi:hypothetical protein
MRGRLAMVVFVVLLACVQSLAQSSSRLPGQVGPGSIQYALSQPILYGATTFEIIHVNNDLFQSFCTSLNAPRVDTPSGAARFGYRNQNVHTGYKGACDLKQDHIYAMELSFQLPSALPSPAILRLHVTARRNDPAGPADCGGRILRPSAAVFPLFPFAPPLFTTVPVADSFSFTTSGPVVGINNLSTRTRFDVSRFADVWAPNALATFIFLPTFSDAPDDNHACFIQIDAAWLTLG